MALIALIYQFYETDKPYPMNLGAADIIHIANSYDLHQVVAVDLVLTWCVN